MFTSNTSRCTWNKGQEKSANDNKKYVPGSVSMSSSKKKKYLRHFPPLFSHVLFTPVTASSPHVFTSFSSALWWHHCLTHSDTYTVLLKLLSRAFGWGLVFVVDRIAVINVPSPDPSCSLHPRPSLRRSSWANPPVCGSFSLYVFVSTCVRQWVFGRQ